MVETFYFINSGLYLRCLLGADNADVVENP